MKMAQLYRESKPVNRKSGSFRKAAFLLQATRRSPCASRIRAFKAFTSHEPLLVRFSRITRHETRITAVMLFTNHGLCGRSVRRGSESFATRKTAARSLLPGARSRGMARHRAARGTPGRCPRAVRISNTACWVFTETRGTNQATWIFPVPAATPRRATPSPTNGFFTNHETRITAFMAARTVAPADKSLLLCPELPGIARNCSVKNVLRQCPCTISRSGSASRQSRLAADPVALRARSAAANAKRTCVEKGGRSRLRRQHEPAI